MTVWGLTRRGGGTTGTGSGDPAAVGRPGAVRGLIFGGAVLIAAIAIGTAVAAGIFRERAIGNSQRELENTVMLLKRHFDQQFSELAPIQRSLNTLLWSNGIITPDNFSKQMSSFENYQMLKAKTNSDSASDLTMLDSNGMLVNWTRSWPAPNDDLSDRDYFRELRDSSAFDKEIVEPIRSRSTGQWKVLFARRLSGPTGEFLGVVTRGIEPEKFARFFASLSLGKNAAITMAMHDGRVLSRNPFTASLVGQPLGPDSLAVQLTDNKRPFTHRLASPVDGQDRLTSGQLLDSFPIAIVASSTLDNILADWRTQTKLAALMAGLSALIIAVLLGLVIRRLSQQHRATQAQLRLEKQRLDTAINNMTQGLLLFDADARVVICNQSYMDMYRLSPDVIRPGLLFRDVIAHRKETGSFQGDVDAYVADVLADIHRETLVVIRTADDRVIQILGRPVADGGWVATHEDVTERSRAEERIAHLAHYDALTDLPNRVLFRDQLTHELTRIPRGHDCAVIYIDIDEFKGINDSLGHPVGDELLKAIANRLKSCVRTSDVVARLGGDEFAIVQTDVRQESEITELVARIYAAIREPIECLGHRLLTDASIGIAMAPRDGTDLDQLLKNADLAMYGAKADGRRTYRFFAPEMDARVKARRVLELDLREAVAEGFSKGGFEIYYQPLLRLDDDVITGCEALLRWHHPLRGMISPAEFIPVAEEIGLISQLGEWVLGTACAEAANWPGDIRVAVNVSPIQFRSQTLALKVASALAASGLAPRRLELEITEAVLIRDDDAALAILHRLRGLGVRIALDDFGTGYSSLSYLQRFPFDKIKIDRCFVTDITEVHGSPTIVQAVVNIAASQHMTTTAEGVETQAQKDLLRVLGCTEMQGYLFSAAKPAADVRALIAAHRLKAAA